MLKTFALAAMLACASITPSAAKNLAIPAKDPAATMWIPDDWTFDTIEFGYEITSPDKGVYMSIEFAHASKLNKLTSETDKWMKRMKIKPKGDPAERELSMSGLPAKMISFKATDENGDTEVHITFVGISKERVIMVTVWSSAEEQRDNAAALQRMTESFKAID